MAALTATLFAAVGPAGAQNYDYLKAEARQIVARFEHMLTERAHETADSGDVSAMMGVFDREAPQLTAYLSRETGWSVKWTSLDLRNPANAPNAHERRVLKAFEDLIDTELEPHSMEYAGLVPRDAGPPQFCYMQAIPAQAMCLECHGKTLSPQIAEKLGERYPDDHATGYNLGEMRGAYSLCTDDYLLELFVGP